MPFPSGAHLVNVDVRPRARAQDYTMVRMTPDTQSGIRRSFDPYFLPSFASFLPSSLRTHSPSRPGGMGSPPAGPGPAQLRPSGWARGWAAGSRSRTARPVDAAASGTHTTQAGVRHSGRDGAVADGGCDDASHVRPVPASTTRSLLHSHSTRSARFGSGFDDHLTEGTGCCCCHHRSWNRRRRGR